MDAAVVEVVLLDRCITVPNFVKFGHTIIWHCDTERSQFFDFQDGCKARISTTHEGYLMVVIIVQNLAAIS